uniref:TIR domain-containing protein n=2 Tax=unclassified Candidatus Kentrum TaxID=2643149 RepID=A0A451A795_9GAMM|nr:MAG: TIR domain-containing protein [Candidatus Kentron sp. LPFa]VFK61901.1 MAG: TIR domain-containing protein [Candidatus Kentron sp. UNK]VFK70049.1 MAG: TIR domain-containing protein [Candidatus Kentron sp. UNK]
MPKQTQIGSPGRDQIQVGRDYISPSSVSSSDHKISSGKPSPEKELKDGYDVFISHWNQEKPLASLLKEWIDSVFQERFRVFVGSEEGAFNMGDCWQETIEQALQVAKLTLVLTSRQSLVRHWVHFETGFAWSRGIPVAFLCHSGVKPNNLPKPYDTRESLDMEIPEFPRRFLTGFARRFDVPRLPPLAFRDMEDELASILNTVKGLKLP